MKNHACSIATDFHPLDSIMGGGLPRGQVTLIYGEPSTGKTSLAIQCAVECARTNLKVIFIDSDNTFPLNRLTRIASNDLDRVSPLIFVSRPRTFSEQSLILENLYNFVEESALVILDSITSLYRIQLGLEDTAFIVNRRLNWQMAHLVQAAKQYNIVVLVVGQARRIVGDKGERGMELIATRLLKFWAQNIIGLRLAEAKALREAIIERHFQDHRIGECCIFSLDDKEAFDLKKLG